MPDQALPEEVRDLVRRRLRSMEEIEVLLLLAASSQSLTVDEICAGLRIPPSALPSTSVERLAKNDLAEVDPNGGVPRYRYSPATPELRRATALLAVAYNERPVSLVRLVYHRDEPHPTFEEGFSLDQKRR